MCPHALQPTFGYISARYANDENGPLHRFRRATRHEKRALTSDLFIMRTIHRQHDVGCRFTRTRWLFITQVDHETHTGTLLAPEELSINPKLGPGFYVEKQLGVEYPSYAYECQEYDDDRARDDTVLADSRHLGSNVIEGQMDALSSNLQAATLRNYAATFERDSTTGDFVPIVGGGAPAGVPAPVRAGARPGKKPRRRKTLFEDGSDDDWFGRGPAVPSATFLQSVAAAKKEAKPKDAKPRRRLGGGDAGDAPKPKRHRAQAPGNHDAAGDAFDEQVRLRSHIIKVEKMLKPKIADLDSAELKLEELLTAKGFPKAKSCTFDSVLGVPDKLSACTTKMIAVRDDADLKDKMRSETGLPESALSFFSSLDLIILTPAQLSSSPCFCSSSSLILYSLTSFSFFIFTTKINSLPLPGSLSTQIVPSIAVTSDLQIESPNPVPPYKRVVESSA